MQGFRASRLPSSLSGLLPALLLAMLPLLQGCQQLSREVLHIYLVPASSPLSGVKRDDTRQLADPLIQAFRRLHPTVDLHVQLVQEPSLENELRQAHRRGLGPDLLLLRSSKGMALLDQGLIDPVPQTPAFRGRESDLLSPILDHVRVRGSLAVLPVFSEVTLACYDRQRVAAAPQTLEQLQALAASGASVGLALDPVGLWWTIGGFRAVSALLPLVYAGKAGDSPSRSAALKALQPWLEWLRQVALQNRVDIAADQDELLSGLMAGRLAWVPCYSPHLLSLQQEMGDRLGVSALPAGPDGPASPFTAVRAWAFGRDSSPRQRRLAEELALLSLNPMLQRQITLISQSTLPINRLVSIPYADSGQLAALGQAQQQLQDNGLLLGLPFSAERMETLLPSIEELVYGVITGVLSPREGAEALLKLEVGR
jgi:hypothetical protein